MKCQAWVDPTKFNKKNRPTPRAFIGSYTLDVARYLGEVTGALHRKRVAQMERAVRCSGHLTVSLYADCGGEDDIDASVYCDDCRDYRHAVGLNADVAEQWLQERLDGVAQVDGLIWTLTQLAEHQGYAGVNVFDGGMREEGGDWSIQVNLERDGLTFGRENITEVDLRRAILDLLRSRRGGSA